jgi:hypothetical protein
MNLKFGESKDEEPEIAICSSMLQLDEQPGCRRTATSHFESSESHGLTLPVEHPTLRLHDKIRIPSRALSK